MDVSDMGKNVLSMGRLIRSGFDLHFTQNGHSSWMTEASTGRIIRLYADNGDAEAPLFYTKIAIRDPADQGRTAAAIDTGDVMRIVGLRTQTEYNGQDFRGDYWQANQAG